ncbi:RNA-directed DNA polymerase (reverse transcriptase)-related family protein [Rhynchospora pubera]|uniref:RNA-directed DNA polymerase (Reverse transcriptase)-related family protein n=1 Tax=Rhynchospora pubera TaxID=906938 RepID=A0AAV8HMA9_9POAL|nr:RNA-directed DNA polymerase (reverse transcriptase)-related family protein [Rhynchospora pubera]
MSPRDEIVTLASSVLTALPSYFMSVFLLPRWLVDAIDKARKRFIWGTNQDGKQRVHLVAWDKLCLPKAVGGLGLKNISLQNRAFLLRWLWFLYNNHNSLWFKTTSKIYSPVRGDVSPIVWNKNGSFFWKDIRSLRHLFQISTRSSIASGINTSFWYDNWAGKPLVPILKGTAKPPRERISYKQGIAALNLRLPRPWELTTQLLLLDFPTTLHSDEYDHLIWRWNADGNFSVSSFYNTFSTAGKLSNNLTCLWSFKVPPSLKFFMFLLSNNKLLTQQQLLRRNLLPLPPHCVMCNQSLLEDSLHLFFSCPFANRAWQRLRNHVSLPPLVESFSARESLLATLQQRSTVLIFQTRLTTFFWAIWQERNNRIFRRNSRNIELLCNWILSESTLYFKHC